jgi:hypothetical protein
MVYGLSLITNHCVQHYYFVVRRAKPVVTPHARGRVLTPEASRRVFMGAGKTLDGVYPLIQSELTGLSLLDNLTRFRNACLAEHHRKPQDEQFFISHFDMACGHDSALSILINTVVMNVDLNFCSPKTHALSIASEDSQAHKRKVNSGHELQDAMQSRAFMEQVNESYPPFVVAPATQDTLDFWIARAQNHDAPYNQVSVAIEQVTALQAEIEALRARHEGREVMDRYLWLLDSTDPGQRDAALGIQRSLEAKRLLGYNRNRDNKYLSYEDRQFDGIDSMRGLSWLCEYVLQHHGTITQADVEMWHMRRMCSGQTPSAAVAKLREEGKVLAQARLIRFDLEHELLKMLNLSDLGAPDH